MRQLTLRIVVLSFVALLGGCSLDTSTSDGTGSKPAEDSTPSQTVSTQVFTAQSLNFLYSTNDSSLKGTTVTKYTSNSTSGAFTFTVTVSKASGNAAGGFGILFQRQDDADFWLADIDTQGSYTIMKLVAGTWSYVTNNSGIYWVPNGAIKTGLGVTNTLELTFDGTSGYSFSVNGTVLQAFTDTGMGTVYTSGGLGLDVGIVSTENFPSTPVSVTFTPTLPSGMSW